MRRYFGKPEATWLVPAVIAVALLVGAIFVPLWRMELVAPQYPEGLVLHAYGYKFEGDSGSHYDDIREINGLNHYIGMPPIEEVTEMNLFLPGVAALGTGTLIVSFVAWKRRWMKGVAIAGFWFVPLFFVADLQYWLYDYGHSLDPRAALDLEAFTPKVIGSTRVFNFHSENSFEIGFYLMVAAALIITFIPPLLGWLQSRRHHPAASSADTSGVPGVAKAL